MTSDAPSSGPYETAAAANVEGSIGSYQGFAWNPVGVMYIYIYMAYK